MRVSVVLCTYSVDMYEHFKEAAQSVLFQSYDNVELVIVVDGNSDLCEMVVGDFDSHEDTIVHCNDQNQGLSYSRNKGAELANGDVVAFLDDDAIADKEWIANLVDAYQRHDALAVGGQMKPEWIVAKPRYIPEEFYFLFGVSYRGFPTQETEVRNTFSSNLSFRREVFLNLGGFREHMGKQGTNNLQGGETELCARLGDEFGQNVIYNPEAKVAHKVFEYRTKKWWLLKRAFWQGFSKRMMQAETQGSISQETTFLKKLMLNFIPGRIKNLFLAPKSERIAKLGLLIILVVSVGMGYWYAMLKQILVN